jgi:exosporium-targeted protein
MVLFLAPSSEKAYGWKKIVNKAVIVTNKPTSGSSEMENYGPTFPPIPPFTPAASSLFLILAIPSVIVPSIFSDS